MFNKKTYIYIKEEKLWKNSIMDLFKASEFSKLGKDSKDKTPISLDGGKDISTKPNLEKQEAN